MCLLAHISKRISDAVFLIIIILNFCLTADAKIYLISIPVTGSYSMGTIKSFSIDLGEPLEQINEVRFICEGTVTAGLDCYMNPAQDKFYGHFDTDPGYMIAGGPWAGTYPDPQPFSANVAFESRLGATWDFLLDGQADGTVYLSMLVTIPECPLIMNPTGYLSAAQIRIDAIPSCQFVLGGDQNDDCTVQLIDYAIFAQDWLTVNDWDDLAVLADNWLIDCFDEPTNPACVPE